MNQNPASKTVPNLGIKLSKICIITILNAIRDRAQITLWNLNFKLESDALIIKPKTGKIFSILTNDKICNKNEKKLNKKNSRKRRFFKKK